MTFWLIAAALTLFASLAVLIPISRRDGASAASGGAHDLTVYTDQLAEVQRDVERGSLEPEQAEQARLEISRRILRLQHNDAPRPVSTETSTGRIIAAAAVLSIPLVSWSLYSALGSPSLPSQPLQARLSKDPADSTPEELVARSESYLAQHPDDGRGWQVLAPAYIQMSRFDDAAMAYRNAIRLLGDTAARRAGLGEALVLGNNGVVSTDADSEFRKALVLQPENATAQFFLALGLQQDGKTADAVAAWQTLLQQPALDGSLRKATQAALAQAQAPASAPGPDASQMDAAASMTPTDRQAMVEQMVAGLDARLRENPGDPEGWIRLVRSYVVLGKQELARDSLERALQALGSDTENGRRVAQAAAEQGVQVTGKP